MAIEAFVAEAGGDRAVPVAHRDGVSLTADTGDLGRATLGTLVCVSILVAGGGMASTAPGPLRAWKAVRCAGEP